MTAPQGLAAFELTDTIADADEAAILKQLTDYNNNVLLGPTDRRGLAIVLRDEHGNADGGLVGHTGRGWLYVRLLFVPERLRGQGLAGRMLQMAEDEARARGCKGAYIDTINPAARRAYERQGYETCGSIENFTGDFSITWLVKRFQTPE